MVGRSVGRSVGWSVGQSISWSVCRSVRRSDSVDRSVSRSVDRSICPSVSRSVDGCEFIYDFIPAKMRSARSTGRKADDAVHLTARRHPTDTRHKIATNCPKTVRLDAFSPKDIDRHPRSTAVSVRIGEPPTRRRRRALISPPVRRRSTQTDVHVTCPTVSRTTTISQTHERSWPTGRFVERYATGTRRPRDFEAAVSASTRLLARPPTRPVALQPASPPARPNDE